jgi:2-polyprenyl-6-hydroxyphenyl methylase/3-demethylubiquinone-9 3-methyltransferase
MPETLGVEADGASVLDVGCGGGLLAEEFATLGCHVTGIDRSAPSIETARTPNSPDCRSNTCGAHASKLSFDDEASDVVHRCDVLEH